jgi:uncharacterized repeat protein (TIGR03803 family)
MVGRMVHLTQYRREACSFWRGVRRPNSNGTVSYQTRDQARAARSNAMLTFFAAIAVLTTSFGVEAGANTVTQNFLANVDGQSPQSALIGDASGAFYGTTYNGGAYGPGCVYKLTPTSSGYRETIIHSFGAEPDGWNPMGGLIEDKNGALYGTTRYGGMSQLGTVFKLVPSAHGYTEKIIYYFQGASGSNPRGSLLADASGSFYGTAEYGPFGDGVDFKLARSGGGYSYSAIYVFQGGADEALPVGSLIADSASDLYGTTYGGEYQYGTVYKLTPGVGGYSESLILSFEGQNGENPLASLAADSSGALYGTTSKGGTAKKGVVFKLTPEGSTYAESVLHDFTGGADGAHPQDDIAVDSGGRVFGTTLIGGAHNAGVVFQLTPSHGSYDFRILHNFAGSPDGANPVAAVIDVGNGVLFGTTTSGGSLRNGTVFRLSPNGNLYREKILHNF